jgi:hypothetical protein
VIYVMSRASCGVPSCKLRVEDMRPADLHMAQPNAPASLQDIPRLLSTKTAAIGARDQCV